ncbi:hypothetical protein BGZ96_012275 [Linnemannia gamsii]|uniref:Fe2OG dioxygenase domain-containing protein n=1 Tax=Linnemannia gamsii TaxID=64522 RepID=A0ABQ7JRM5_9FUNG|nr:hypothetical protein BGZ96_012275 [Linnemannia gamsii]
MSPSTIDAVATATTTAMPLLKSDMTTTAIDTPSPLTTRSCMSNSTALPAVKVLSLRDYLTPETRTQFLQEMRQSLMTIGTFYIKDHGVATELTTGAMRTVRDYFSLPLEEKKKMMIGNSRHFRGYKLIGEELTNNQVDHREQLQFAPEQAPLDGFTPSVSPSYHGLQGPNQWPATTLTAVPEFQSTILSFMTELETLSQNLMEAIALSLGLEASYFRTMFGQTPYYRLKCAKYPSVNKAATIGCGAHKDTGFLTVLLQDMVGGLQGQDPKTGEWMDTRPIPDTFIVTMGEAIERMTGGLYHATVHRVLNNTSGQDRYSIPFFFDPALDAKIPHRIPHLSTSSKVLVPSMSSLSLIGDSDSEFDSETDERDGLVDALGIHGEENARTEGEVVVTEKVSRRHSRGTWSNGEHIFETVHRCHPEVFARWYTSTL